MAAAWLRHLARDRATVVSGGSDPAAAVNPVAVAAMAEVGIDLADQRPARWDDATLRGADVVVTMGCGDSCPVFPGVQYVDWKVPDPAGKPLDEVRPIRDEIELRVRELMAELRIGGRS
jgi:arsenate reductase